MSEGADDFAVRMELDLRGVVDEIVQRAAKEVDDAAMDRIAAQKGYARVARPESKPTTMHVPIKGMGPMPECIVGYTELVSKGHPYAEMAYYPLVTARRVIVSNKDTDHATGHTECGHCHGEIDFWDARCRHCGARLED